MQKRKYPRNDDVRSAIVEVLSRTLIPSPSEFCDEVVKVLEKKGFNCNFLNTKRIWRIYEEMVRKGLIYDVLGVVRERSSGTFQSS